MPTNEIFNLGDGIVLQWTNSVPNIKKVIFHDPATIVYWEDGSKTVVKVQEGDEWDAEKGLAMAVFKKIYGLDEMKKWLPKEEYVDQNKTLDEQGLPSCWTCDFYNVDFGICDLLLRANIDLAENTCCTEYREKKND